MKLYLKLVLIFILVITLFINACAKNSYDEEEVKNYFMEIALKYERKEKGYVSKWLKKEISIFVCGDKKEKYIKWLDESINELENAVGKDKIDIYYENDALKADIMFFFGTGQEFINYTDEVRGYPFSIDKLMDGRPFIPQFSKAKKSIKKCWGFGRPINEINGETKKGYVLVKTYFSSSKIKHLIKEELIQILGLTNDIRDIKYRNSIFYEGVLDSSLFMPTKYAEIDKKIFQILYSDYIEPGMRKEDVEEVFREHPELLKME
jgi:hypothetical protein